MWRALAGTPPRTGVILRQAAADLKLIIVAPIYELDARTGKRFNAAVVIDEGRVLGNTAKPTSGRGQRRVFHGNLYYGRGEGRPNLNGRTRPALPVFQTTAEKSGRHLYDRHFEGVVGALAASGAQLVFCPAVTFGAKSRRLWELEFPVDACRHRVFIGGSNRLGRERPWNQEYFGGSFFAGPDGNKLKNLSRNPRGDFGPGFGLPQAPDPPAGTWRATLANLLMTGDPMTIALAAPRSAAVAHSPADRLREPLPRPPGFRDGSRGLQGRSRRDLDRRPRLRRYALRRGLSDQHR